MLTTYKTTLSEKKELAKDIFLFRFQLIEPKEIAFKAGQYLILKIGDKSRLYSIASPDFQKDSFELLVQIIPDGAASTYLSNLKIGDEATFQGSAGLFTLRDPPAGGRRDKIFLATGTGIAPIRSIISSLLNSKSQPTRNKQILNHNPQETKSLKFEKLNIENCLDTWNLGFGIYLFWGLRYFSDVYFLDELKSYKLQATSFDFKICLSREQNLEMISEEDKKYFTRGHVNDGFEREIENLIPPLVGENFDYYLCGSREVVESLRQYLDQKSVPKDQVFFEKF